MSATIRITSGSYRNVRVENQVFTLVKGYQLTAKGGNVTVKNDGQFPGWGPIIKINVADQTAFEFLGSKDRKSVV